MQINKHHEVKYIGLDKIVPDKDQPRKVFDIIKLKSLKDSIKLHGIINPLSVQVFGDKYLLIDGERRYRCAVDLKLDSIPCYILEPKDNIDKLIQQFHIQEHHSGWSAIEKALAMKKISLEMGIPFANLGELLGINNSTLNSYRTFLTLYRKDLYQKEELPLRWAEGIRGIVVFLEKRYKESGKNMPIKEKEETERLLIESIKSGDLKKVRDIAKLKDAFRHEPKSYDKFLKGKVSIEELIEGSQSTKSHYVKSAMVYTGWASSYVNKSLEARGRIILTEAERKEHKGRLKTLAKLLD